MFSFESTNKLEVSRKCTEGPFSVLAVESNASNTELLMYMSAYERLDEFKCSTSRIKGDVSVVGSPRVCLYVQHTHHVTAQPVCFELTVNTRSN